MGYKIVDWTLSKTFEFAFFEDAEFFFKDYRFSNPLSEISFYTTNLKTKDNTADRLVAKYVPN